jgi:hypothetical protein
MGVGRCVLYSFANFLNHNTFSSDALAARGDDDTLILDLDKHGIGPPKLILATWKGIIFPFVLECIFLFIFQFKNKLILIL